MDLATISDKVRGVLGPAGLVAGCWWAKRGLCGECCGSRMRQVAAALAWGTSPLPAPSPRALAPMPFFAAAAAQERLLQRGPRVPGRCAASVGELHAGEGRDAGSRGHWAQALGSSGSLLSPLACLQRVYTVTHLHRSCHSWSTLPNQSVQPLPPPSTQYNGPDHQVTRDAAVTRRQFEQVGGRPGHKVTGNGPLSSLAWLIRCMVCVHEPPG